MAWLIYTLYQCNLYFCTDSLFHVSAVALALCGSDPVLNDGQSSDSSKDDVIEGVRRRFIEKVVTQHEDGEDEYSSD